MPFPPFKPTRRLRDKVMCLVADGMGERGICEVIGVARETLSKHFAHELEVGRAKKEAELNELLWTSARNHNVTAITRLLDRASGERVPHHMKLGKKEMQAEAAAVAGIGTEWEADLMRVMPPADDKPN